MEEYPDADREQTGAKLELGEFVLHLRMRCPDAKPARQISRTTVHY
jgi:hypothetical protein